MLLVTAFFITMNVLLWRSEFGGRHFGSSVPAETVWDKILTAPDRSDLSIAYHGKKIGVCHWSSSVGEERGRALSEELPPEGMMDEPTSYSIDATGSVLIDAVNRVRFNFDLRLNTNQAWQEFGIRITLRPSVWELKASAVDESVRLYIDDGQERSEKIFTFADLRNPDKILKEIGGPLLPAALAPLGLSRLGSDSSLSAALKWEARYDRLQIGADWMRVYRLQARLFDRFQAVVFVSLVGEILRVELPDQVLLTHDAFANFSDLEDDRTDPRR
jgi:hypothetical protein